MTKIWYDTEFLEDGHTIELISIGLVAEDGRELYAVNEEIVAEPLYSRICKHQWLMKNVVPHLPLSTAGTQRRHGRITTASGYLGFFHLDMTSNDVMPRRMIRNAVRDFILATPTPELWAWYGAYDHVALCQLWGRMIDLPEGVPMWTNDLKQEAARLGNPDMPEQGGGEHNALADARHNRVMGEFLDSIADIRRTQLAVRAQAAHAGLADGEELTVWAADEELTVTGGTEEQP